MLKSFVLLLVLTLQFPLFGQEEIFLSTLDNRIYSLDLTDCSFQQVGVMPISSTDISFHPNGNLYAVSSTGSLFEIDLITGNSTLLHTFEQGATQLYTALTISAEGIFYASGLNGDLWSYDLITDTGTYLGDIGFGAEGDLTFYEGQLYMASQNDNIVLVDIQNPGNSSIAVNGNVTGRIFGVVSFAETCEDVSVYALTNNAASVYEVNFVTNTLDFYCSIPLQVSGGASTFEFLGSNPVFIDNVVESNFDCLNANGQININASGGVGDLTYSLDGINYQSNPDFSNLSLIPFTVYVADEVGCVVTLEIVPDGNLPIFDQLQITDASCGLNNGQITVAFSGGSPPYEFYVDGVLNAGLTLENSPGGQYNLEVRDAIGCSTTEQVVLMSSDPLGAVGIAWSSTSCGQDDGTLSVVYPADIGPLGFSLNNGPMSQSGEYSNLPAGQYFIDVINSDGCTKRVSATIEASTPLFIDGLFTENASCEERTGRVEIQASGGVGPLDYLFDDLIESSAPIFDQLVAGNYDIAVSDSLGCTRDTTFEILDSPPVELNLVDFQSATCLEANGQISLIATGGSGNINLRQNGRDIDYHQSISNLTAGEYFYVVSDSLGCSDSVQVTLPAEKCLIYLPNSFSPNLDGVNDVFGPLSVPNSSDQIISMQIFDRWGGLVFAEKEGSFDDPKFKWDGRAQDKIAEVGTYVYYLKVQSANGSIELLSGAVLLIR